MTKTKLTLAEWKEKGTKIFGSDIKKWRFQCPHCKESQSLQDFIDAEVENPNDTFFFSCIGRWVKERGCDWTLGGLFQIHETEVINEEGEGVPVMEFADIPEGSDKTSS